jgi:peroxidase
MANTKLIVLAFSLYSMLLPFANAQGLTSGFYNLSCPSAENLVKTMTEKFVSHAPSFAPALLRIHFHDCFVRGCDGSVLVNSTSNNTAEKDGIPNLTLRGFQIIDAIKSALEKQCPGVVSCADIVALVARDAVTAIGGPTWQVLTGRRDGTKSLATDALTGLPAPFMNITQLKAKFASVGLSVKDLAVLSGGHTIGVGHCTTFESRLHNSPGKHDSDPSLHPNYVALLKKKCPLTTLSTSIVEMDPGSFRTFDTHYYSIVGKRKGLFTSDGALLTDSTTLAYVQAQASPQSSTFLTDFGQSMMNMGKIGVLTGTSGTIRKHCAVIN